MWDKVERTRTILQISVAVLTLAGALFALMRYSVPGWLTILISAIAYAAGFFLGKRNQGTKTSLRPEGLAINHISLHKNDPTSYGWSISHDERTEPEVLFKLQDNEEIGRSMLIDAAGGSHVDYELAQADFIADEFELVYRPEAKSAFYVRLTVIGAVHNPERHWIQYQIGRAAPKKLTSNEWVVTVQPLPIAGKWLRLRRNLRSDFELTFGRDGLDFDHVSAVRVRGKMSISSITLFVCQKPVNR